MANRDLMYKISAFQLFDGSFNLDGSLCGAINVNLANAQQEATKKGWNPKGYATTLALAFFREKLGNLQEDWELIADKSRIWLIQNAATQADSMFESATNTVKK